MLPESYASTARVKVEKEDAVANGATTAYDPFFIQTQFEIIQSEFVLKPVIEKLNLNGLWGKKYFAGEPLKTTRTLEFLRMRLDLRPVKNTTLIAITVYSDDKNEAAQIANAVASAYRDYREESRAGSDAERLKALNGVYQAQETQIEKSRAELDALQEKFGISPNSASLTQALSDTQNSYVEIQAKIARLGVLNSTQKRQELPSILPDATLNDLLAKLHEAEANFAVLTNDYSMTALAVMRAKSVIDTLNNQIDDRVAGLMAGIESQAAAKKAAVDELARLVEKSKPTPETKTYWDAKQDLEQLSESHKLLFAKIEDQKLAAQIPQLALAQITDTAQPGFAPVRPNKPLNIFVGAVAGIFFASIAGAGLACLAFFLGKRFQKTAAVA